MVKARCTYMAGVGKVRLVERDLQPRDDEVLVKTHSCSICDSDRLLYQGEPLPIPLPPENFIGHEGGGTVVEVGGRVHEYRPGDRVMFFGFKEAMADYVVSQPAFLHPVPEGLDMDIASLGEPLAVPMYAVFQSGVQPGDSVAVFGLGFNGQIITQGVRKKGATRIIAVDAYDGRLLLNQGLGCTDVVINSEAGDAQQAIMDLTGGRGVDVVIEATGYGHKCFEKYMNVATQVVKHNGIFVMVGWPTVPINIHLHRWHHHALDFRAVAIRHHNPTWERLAVQDVMRPFQQNLIEVKRCVTAEYPLARVAEAFADFDRNPNHVKIVLRP